MKIKFVFIFIGILFFLIFCSLIFKNINNSNNSIYSSPIPSPTIITEINSSTPNPTVFNNTNNSSIATMQPTSLTTSVRGQIVCNYLSPAGPNHFGTANINSNWNNTRISVCTNVSRANTLISNDENLNGSRTDNINWVSLNISYQFNLYSNVNCSGTILSSCQINQIAPTTSPK